MGFMSYNSIYLRLFSLSLIFSCFTAMYLGMFLFVLMLLAVCIASQTCDLPTLVSFGKLLASIFSNTVFSHSFSHFFLGLKIHICQTFLIVSRMSLFALLYIFIFLYFCNWFEYFSINLSYSSLNFLLPCLIC